MASIDNLPAIISTAPSQQTNTGLVSGQPSQIAEKSHLTENSQAAGKSDLTENNQTAEKSHLTENGQTAEKNHLTENNQTAEKNHLTENSQTAEKSHLTENNQPSIHTEHSHTSENSQLTETNKRAESGLSIGQLETSMQSKDFKAPSSYTARLGEKPWTIQSHRHKLLVGFSLLKVCSQICVNVSSNFIANMSIVRN